MEVFGDQEDWCELHHPVRQAKPEKSDIAIGQPGGAAPKCGNRSDREAEEQSHNHLELIATKVKARGASERDRGLLFPFYEGPLCHERVLAEAMDNFRRTRIHPSRPGQHQYGPPVSALGIPASPRILSIRLSARATPTRLRMIPITNTRPGSTRRDRIAGRNETVDRHHHRAWERLPNAVGGAISTATARTRGSKP